MKRLITWVLTLTASANLAFSQLSYETAAPESAAGPIASQVLKKIMEAKDKTPLGMYPPGYLDRLKALGDNPIPTGAVSSVNALARSQPQRDGPINSDTSSPTYTVVDLGTLGGSSSQAYGINAGGQVVGVARTSSERHAFLWSNGLIQDLGTPGGYESVANGINANGQVVGRFFPAGTFMSHPFLYSNGSMQDMGTLGGDRGEARAINSSGQVVGYSWDVNNNSRVFLYSNGTMQDIGTLTGDTFGQAQGINNIGQIVGWSRVDPISDYHAFLWSNGSMQNLGTLGTWAIPSGINDSGQVTGNSWVPSGFPHGFLWSNGSMQDIGILPGGVNSSALGINNHAQIVGTSADHAFLYSSGVMQDLNDLVVIPASGWTLQVATAINDAGQIVGWGINSNGQQHAFLLNPIPSCSGLNITGFKQGDGEVAGTGVPQYFGVGGASRTSKYGCLLCAAASMLTSIPGLGSMTPTELDQKLLGVNGYGAGDNLICSQLPKAVSGKIRYVGAKDDIRDWMALDAYLNEHFCGNGQRVILRLSPSAAVNPDNVHFVLVTGRSGSDWTLFDPGWKNAYPTSGSTTADPGLLTSLMAHTNGFYIHPSGGGVAFNKFYIAGVRTFSVDGSSGIFNGTVQSPVEILVTAPDGKRVGYDPATSNDVFEISGSSYIRDYPIMDADMSGVGSGETNGVKTFCVPNPLGGTYQVQLTGTAPGSYTFDIGTFWGNGSGQPTETSTGTTDVGVTVTNQFFVKVPPLITGTSLGANTFSLSFTTQSNVTYDLQGKVTLDATNWTTFQSLTATGSVAHMSQSVTNPTMFYRVMAQ